LRGTGVRRVYENLKREILDMTLAPGDQLDETHLSTRFSLSRTPVREALVRLTAEGLATTLPNRNTIVSTIDFGSVAAYLDALTLMYRLTSRLAAERRTVDELQDIRRVQATFSQAVADADAIAMIIANRDFHLAISKAGRNAYYHRFFASLLDEGQRLLRIYYSSYDDHLPKEFVDEHDTIIDAIDRRDADRAERLGGEHALQVVRQLQVFLGEGPGRSISIE
jgi:DNA-binding GntR family transcriptional regulator